MKMRPSMSLQPFTSVSAIVISALLIQSAAMTADIEITKVEQMTMSHSLDWVRSKFGHSQGGNWDSVLDEIKWGTPAEGKKAVRNWDYRVTDQQWTEYIEKNGAAPDQEVKFDLWIPGETKVVKGLVAISSHGSGKALFENPELRKIARKLDLALFRFLGNPVQRGFWPRSLLFDKLRDFGNEAGHPELPNAPLFLYGHSNGTGFSAIFTAGASGRVWGWVSMRPGTTFQVFQPRAAAVPGLVIFGEDDHFLARPSIETNLDVVPLMRKQHNAVWNFAVEPNTGHGPTAKTWPLVFSFLKHSFAARVPADADPSKGPVKLTQLDPDSGLRGGNWNSKTDGYQTLKVGTLEDFKDDDTGASWLLNADYAKDWQTFQQFGEVR
ncbi:MAG: hypothetical protein P1V20_23835 [Verrucomicrobiales bacterium]|nr:hypothetical protein [Verrucomicrobiales bacterium]